MRLSISGRSTSRQRESFTMERTLEADSALCLSWDRPDAKSVVLRLDGELELATVRRFDEALEAAFGAGAGRVILDFTRVSYLDTAGIGGILRAIKRYPAPTVHCLVPSPACWSTLET